MQNSLNDFINDEENSSSSDDDVSSSKTKRANELNGKDWTRFSISVWRDIKKNGNERKLKHPAMFPAALVERLIQCYTRDADTVILDPFSGSGSTLLAARNMNRKAIGFELSKEYIQLAESRLGQSDMFVSDNAVKIIPQDARNISKYVEPESVHFCVTSPPYWNILQQKRTADNKDIRNYGNYEGDLGDIDSYQDFLSQLQKVWEEVYKVLIPSKYMVINVMDLRKGPEFIPYHIDIISTAKAAGFTLDDIIIWDRSADYNNLRALGFPSVFRINKVHEFLLIFQKL